MRFQRSRTRADEDIPISVLFDGGDPSVGQIGHRERDDRSRLCFPRLNFAAIQDQLEVRLVGMAVDRSQLRSGVRIVPSSASALPKPQGSTTEVLRRHPSIDRSSQILPLMLGC